MAASRELAPRDTTEVTAAAGPGLDMAAVAAASNSRARRLGQGFGAPAAVNRAVELRAMQAARQYFEALGYAVEDTSATKPYDLLLTRGGERLTVEVKGTTSAGARVLLTANEVMHVQANPGTCVLFVLSAVDLSDTGEEPSAVGGTADDFVAVGGRGGAICEPSSSFTSCRRSWPRGRPERPY